MIIKSIAFILNKFAKNKSFSLINLLSLTIGIFISIIIFFWIKNERSFDKFHKDSKNLYRVVSSNNSNGEIVDLATTWAPIGNAMVEYFPDVLSSTKLYAPKDRVRIEVGDDSFFENEFLFADSSFFSLFSFKVLFGDPKTMLVDPLSIVLTKSNALKYHKKIDALGEILKLDGKLYKVTGVIDDLPGNTHFKFVALMSFSSLNGDMNTNSYQSLMFYNYILINDKASLGKIEVSFEKFQLSLMAKTRAELTKIALQPVEDIHLKSNRLGELGNNGNIVYVYFFIVVGIIILLITGVNFAILFMAQTNKMVKILGVYHIHGCSRRQLIMNIWFEIIVFLIMALIISLLGLKLSETLISQVLGSSFTLNIFSLEFLFEIIAIIVVISLISLIYPSFFVLSFSPIKVLKKEIIKGSSVFNSRGVLLIFQFLISVSLISCSTIVFNQLSFIHKKDIGFDKNNVMCIRLKGNAVENRIDVIKSELNSSPNIIGVACSAGSFGKTNYISAFWLKDPSTTPPLLIKYDRIDPDFIATMKLHIIEGRGFIKTTSEDNNEILVNEKFLNQVDWKEPIGEKIFHNGREFKVVGVVKNFNDQSLYNDYQPFVFTMVAPNRVRYLNIRYQGVSSGQIKSEIKNKLLAIGIITPQEFFEMNDSFDQFYTSENKLGMLLLMFTILVIVISSLGLYGISQYISELRIKEIGVRKVLGDSVLNIIISLNIKFVKWVLIAIILSCPIVFYCMTEWLNNFEFHIFSWWPFLLSGFIAILVAILTVSIHAYRCATVNPVISLKTE